MVSCQFHDSRVLNFFRFDKNLVIVNAFYLMPVLQVLNEVDKLTILLHSCTTLIRMPVWQMLAQPSFNLKSFTSETITRCNSLLNCFHT